MKQFLTKHITPVFYALLSIFLVAMFAFAVGGCDTLRFAPSEFQKQIALKTHLTARSVAHSGAQPGTETTDQLIEGTAVALQFTGMPSDPDIEDYTATLDQAADDAARRPEIDDVFDAADEGLGLAAQLAILFGFGGGGIGGKKVLEWIAVARNKSKALQEIVQGNEQLKGMLKSANVPDAFGSAHGAQTPATRRLVNEIRNPT